MGNTILQCVLQENDAAQRVLLRDTRLVANTALRLTRIPQQFYRKDASPAEVTRAALDHSFCARSLIAKCSEHLTAGRDTLQFR